MSRMLSLVVLITIILIVGAMFYQVMAMFLLPLFLATVLTVLFRPLYRRLLVRFPDRPRLAALGTTLGAALVVMLPAALILTMSIQEATNAVADMDSRTLTERVSRLRQSLHLEMPFAVEIRYIESGFRLLTEPSEVSVRPLSPPSLDDLLSALQGLEQSVHAAGKSDNTTELDNSIAALHQAQKTTTGSLQFGLAVEEADHCFRRFTRSLVGGGLRYEVVNLLNPTEQELRKLNSRMMPTVAGRLGYWGGATGAFVFNLLFNLTIMAVALYYFLADGPSMVQTVMRLSPLDDEYEQLLLDDFNRATRAVVMATLLGAVAQGVVAGLGYWVIGAKLVFFLTLLTTVMALVPFVGAMSVWLPVSCWIMFVEQRYLAGGLLAAWGFCAVSMVDNIVKPAVLHGQSNLHPLLALLSVLGGVQALGPVGILIGPMIVVFLQSSLTILQRESEKAGTRASNPGPRAPLPLDLSLRIRSLRLIYAPPRKVIARSLKERRE